MARKMRVFLAMDTEAFRAYKEKRFKYIYYPCLLRSAQQLVNEGEIPSMPIDSQTMGVKCNVTLLEQLILHSRARTREARKRKTDATKVREMIFAGITA